MVSSRQENDLRPLLETLDEVLIRSALGKRDPDIHFTFAPLAVMTEAEAASIAKTKAETTKIYADSGLLPTIALEKGVQNQLVEDGTYPGLDGALAELSEAERFPSEAEDDEAVADPSEMQAEGQVLPFRRAANDALVRLVTDQTGMDEAAVRAFLDAGGGRQAEPPFRDARRRRPKGHPGRESHFDPTQPRGLNGRWIPGRVRQVLDEAARGPSHARHVEVGKVGGEASKRLAALGLSGDRKAVVFSGSAARHIFLRHGNDGGTHRGVRGGDIASAATVLNRASRIRLGRPAPNGNARVVSKTKMGSSTVYAVFDHSKKHLSLVTMWIRK